MFQGGIKLGRIFGIPIRLDYSWFIIFFLLTIQLSVIGRMEFGGAFRNIYFLYFISALTAILLFVSILLHELGHSVVALRKGIAIRNITLFVFGGVAETTQEPRTASEEFQIAAAGPIVSVVIAVVAWSLLTLKTLLNVPDYIIFMLTYIVQVNTFVVGFNMIPGFPLDGGRILRAILWKYTGNLRKSTRIATIMGQIVGFGLILFGVFSIFQLPVQGIFLILIGIFLFQAAQSSYQHVLVRSALSGVKVREVMSHPVTTVNSWLTIDELINDYFLRYRFSSFPVLDDGELKGYVTLNDAKDIQRTEWFIRRVTDILKPLDKKYLITSDMDAVDALTKMVRQDIHKLIVVQESQLVGVVTLPDLMSLFKIKTDLGDE